MAERLVDLMYSWMDRRRDCAQNLMDLASELESLRQKCNASETVGNSVAVVGAGCMIGAGLLTFATGGIAAPFLGVLGAAYSTVGATITVTTKIIEGFSSSAKMKKAMAEDRSANWICSEINEEFEDLKRSSPSQEPESVSRYVMKEVLRALAKRSGLGASDLDFGTIIGADTFTKGYLSRHSSFDGVLKESVIGVLSVFTLKVEDKVLTSLLAKGAEEIMKKMVGSGFKTALRGSARVVGGVLGLVFSLPDAIQNWEAQIKNDHVTDASQSLKDTSSAILRVVEELQEKLNSISEEFEELKQVKECIEDSSCQGRESVLLRYAVKHCTDAEVRACLLSEGACFLGLVQLFQMMKGKIHTRRKKEKWPRNKEIDIVFVAHGDITGSMMSSALLTPLPTILDVLLYEPWNCTINARVVYGIARGSISPHHRVFLCENGCPFRWFPHSHTPSHLPFDWNSMKESGGAPVPHIMVTSLNAAQDPAWGDFLILKQLNRGRGGERVLIPFILPRHAVVRVPFALVTLALALVLLFSRLKARVHLAACLCKESSTTALDESYLRRQYACTRDHSQMSSEEPLNSPEDPLLRSLTAIFG